MLYYSQKEEDNLPREKITYMDAMYGSSDKRRSANKKGKKV